MCMDFDQKNTPCHAGGRGLDDGSRIFRLLLCTFCNVYGLAFEVLDDWFWSLIRWSC